MARQVNGEALAMNLIRLVDFAEVDAGAKVLLDFSVTFYSRDRAEFARECHKRLADSGSEWAADENNQIGFQIAAVVARYEGVPRSFRCIEKLDNGGDAEQKFFRRVADKLATELSNGNIDLPEALSYLPAFRTTDQRNGLVEQLVRHLIYTDETEQARALSKLYWVEPVSETAYPMYFSLTTGEEEFEERLSDAGSGLQRDYLRHWKARCELGEGRPDKAVQLAGMFESRGDDLGFFRDELAAWLANRGYIRRAMSVLKGSPEARSPSHRFNQVLATTIGNQDAKSAARLLQLAQLDSGSPQISGIARLFRDRPELPSHISMLLALQEICPESAEFDRLLAWCYAKQGQVEKAIESARRAAFKSELSRTVKQLTYDQMERWGIHDRLLGEALESTNPRMIQLAVRLQKTQIENVDLADAPMVDELTRLIRDSDGPAEFKAMAFLQLAKFMQPELPIFAHY